MKTLGFIILLIFTCVSAQDRKVTSFLNPGLQNNSTDVTLVHVIAKGAKDTVHQIWDFTQGMPTVIFTVTTPDTSLNVTWELFKPKTFAFSQKPMYSFAAVIDKLYEYNDIEEKAEITDNSPHRVYDLASLQWKRIHTISNEGEAKVELESKRFKAHNGWRSGTIGFKLDFLPYKDSAAVLPHLIHTANSTLVDVRLVNLTTSPDYNSSRFALHFLIASFDDYYDTLHLNMRKSLDDEHTPGVFEIVEIRTPASFDSDNGGYLQFRPVAYKEEQRAVDSSTNLHVSHFNRANLPDKSTVSTYFDNMEGLVQEMYISFGDSDDGFYKKSNYTSWSFTMGYGLPPVEGFSLFVILVISIGLGVPVVLAVSGITYVLVRKCKQRNPPQRLINDD